MGTHRSRRNPHWTDTSGRYTVVVLWLFGAAVILLVVAAVLIGDALGAQSQVFVQ